MKDRGEARQRDAVLRWLRGAAAAEVARGARVAETTLRRWGRDYLRSKLAHAPGDRTEARAPVGAAVDVRRDTWGIVHVAAASERDAFLGLGYAMAQDRLWQLDYQRRLMRGELAAILGPGSLESDRAMRTIGIAAAAERIWRGAPADVRAALEGLADGINLWTAVVGDRLPIEFEVLEHRPTEWRPADSIAIWMHRWWLLTGRLEAVYVADAARRLLPPALYAAFRQVELADELIVTGGPLGEAAAGGRPAGAAGGAFQEGSNNWVVGGAHTTTGAPVLCSDPHNAYAAPSQWFEAQVSCPSFDAAGAFYIGTIGLYLGRNRDVAWGLTNHAVTVRDLYVETIAADRPGHYRDGDVWRSFEVERHEIAVAGQSPDRFEVRRTRRGPIVNHLIPLDGALLTPDAARPASPLPLSLRWIGAEVDASFEASLGLLRARSADDVLAALRRWHCPPLNYVYADANGRIGYHAAGLVPRRASGDFTIRRADDPADAWDGTVDFDEMPRVADPARGWVATANQVPDAVDPWYLSLGQWSDGHRGRRIHTRITAKERLSPDEIAAIHADAVSNRAREVAPTLLAVVGAPATPTERAALAALRRWDYDFDTRAVGATVFAAFWERWCETVAAARFPAELVAHAIPFVDAAARRLLEGEPIDWFAGRAARDEARATFAATIAELEEVAGPRVRDWRWGRLHQIVHRHPMGRVPARTTLWDVGPGEMSGGTSIVNAAGHGSHPPFDVVSGSTYRFVADLSRPDAMRSVQTCGQSAQPGSPHYRDQFPVWLADSYHPLWMDPAVVATNLESQVTLRP